MSYIGNSLPANFQSLPAVQRFNGDGSDTTFTLAAQIANDQSILVSVDGVTQDSNAYAVSGTTLTFTAAPSAGTGNIFVNTISPVGSTVVPPDGSVTPVRTTFFISQATAPSAPSEGDMWFNTSASTVSGIVSKTSAVYNGTEWRQMSAPVFSATGGTKTTSGAYTIHTFTSSSTFIPNTDGSVDYLVVAGGGGGANSNGGAGGAGGFLTGSADVSAATYTVTVGAGGGIDPGANGANSIISGSGITTITSVGGGAGVYSGTAGTGGSGGGGGGQSSAASAGGAATAGQGNAGGAGKTDSSGAGGGGGGASAVGTAGGFTAGGAGGAGSASSISGASVTYAGGGGGGGDNSASGAGGSGGSGGGGRGGEGSSSPAWNGVAGTANLGGGGGGGGGRTNVGNGDGGAGGSGIVIIRYLT